MMAMSVNRRIGRNLLLAMGHRDPESMIRARSTDRYSEPGFMRSFWRGRGYSNAGAGRAGHCFAPPTCGIWKNKARPYKAW